MKKLLQLLMMLVLTATSIAAQETDLALNKTNADYPKATASVNSENAYKALDGVAGDNNAAYQWESGALAAENTPAWWQIDLGPDFTGQYNTIQMVWEGAMSYDYDIAFSTDGTTFSEPIEIRNQNESALTITTKTGTHTERYIRVTNVRARNAGWGIKIQAFRLYNATYTLTSATATPNNVRINKETAMTLKGFDQFGSELEGVEFSYDGTGTYNTETNTLTATAAGNYTFTAKLGGTEVKTNAISVYTQQLDHITVSPTLVRGGTVSEALTLTAYDQQGEVISEGVEWSAKQGETAVTMTTQNKLDGAASGTVTITGTIGGVSKTFDIYAFTEADHPRIPTDVFLPIFTVIDDNEKTEWGWANGGIDIVDDLKPSGRKAKLLKNFKEIAVNNTQLDIWGNDFGVRFNPTTDDYPCESVKMDVFAPVAGIKARIALELEGGAYRYSDYKELNVGWNNEIEVSVKDLSYITAVKIQTENQVADIILANIYFTKQHKSDIHPKWMATWDADGVETTKPQVDASKTTQTTATIKMTVSDDLSKNIFFVVTNPDDDSYVKFLKGTAEQEVTFELIGLKAAQEVKLNITAYDEGGLATSTEQVTVNTEAIKIKSVDVTPQLQYVKEKSTTSALTVVVTDEDGKTYTEGFTIDYTLKSQEQEGLLTYVADSKGQYTTADVEDQKKGIVTVTATSGSYTKSAEATIVVYEKQQLTVKYTVNKVEKTETVNTGELSTLENYLNINSLEVVNGFLNDDDLRTLRQMAGAVNCMVNAAVDDLIDNGELAADTPEENDTRKKNSDELRVDDDNTTVGQLSELNLSGAILIASEGNTTFARYSNVNRNAETGEYTENRTHIDCTITSADVLPNHIFANCVNLKSLTLPSTITAFEGKAHFAGCHNLTTVNGLPKTITGATPEYWFYRSGITSFDFSDYAFTEIGASAFRDCFNMTSVNLGTKMEWIHFNAFEDCHQISLVPQTDGVYTFPEGLVNIDNLAFQNCVGMVTSDGTNKDFDNTYVIEEGRRKVNYSGKRTVTQTEAYIWEVTDNGDGTFTKTQKLTTLDPAYSFEVETGATGLSGTLKFPSTLTYIGQAAFQNDAALKFIDLTGATSLETIENGAFTRCTNMDLIGTDTPDQNAVRIPEGIKYLGDECFGETGITGFVQIPLTLTDATLRYGVFDNSLGITATQIREGLKEISNVAFAGTGLYDILYPASLLRVGTAAFNRTRNMETAYFISNTDNDKGYLLIDGVAFQWSTIESAKWEDGVKIQMNNAVFYECPNLTDATALEFMEHEWDGIIREAVFFGCTALKDVIIPSNITQIDDEAFYQDEPSTIKTITVTSATAPTCISYGTEPSVKDENNQIITKGYEKNPFSGCVPNHVEIVFDDNAETGYKTYRANSNSEWMRLLTKTATEGERNATTGKVDYDVVKQKHGDFVLKRTFDAQGWNTLVVPFMVTNKFEKKGVDGSADYQLQQTLGTKAVAAYYEKFSEAEKEFKFQVQHENLTAFKPFIVWIESVNDDNLYTFEDVNINFDDDCTTSYEPKDVPVTTYGDADKKYNFTGTYVLTTTIPENSYVIKQNKGYFTSGTRKAASQGFRAWLQPYSADAPAATAKELNMTVDFGETNGIEAIQNSEFEIQNSDTVYDLSGRLVPATQASSQLKPGIYIVNGKKMIVK